MTSRSSFLRAAAGGLGAAALAGCGGSVVPPTSAFPAILPNARRAVRRAFDPARLRYTAVETADATLTNLMDHAGVKTFIQNGILVRSSSLSRHLSPLGNVDCLEPPNCSPAGQTEFYFGGFDNPSVGTGTDVSVGF